MRELLFVALFIAGCGSKTGNLPSPIHHGDWVSSGGERFKDANNPWWVKNTDHVRYCITVDEATISATPKKIRQVVRETLIYWTTEFNRKTVFFKDPVHSIELTHQLGVGKQEFERIECDGSEDLRFQFGYGTLSEEQKAFLKDPQHYIAIAVRTAYDEENLRGKGFIFIGSDIGPHRFGPDTQIEGVWKYELAVRVAIAHELGHVFGLPHVGNSRYALMGADILELFTSKPIEPFVQALQFEEMHSANGFFVPKDVWRNCAILDTDKKLQANFFAHSIDEPCLEFRMIEPDREMEIHSFADEKSKVGTLLGRLDSLDVDINYWPTSGVVLMLNPKQRVFSKAFPEDQLWMLMGPAFTYGAGGARVKLKDGRATPVHFEVGPEQFDISAIVDGVNKTVIRWSH